MVRRVCAVTRVASLAIAMAATAQAFLPPACDEDPARVIFAGAGEAPCKKFNNDPTACTQSYYMNRDGDAVSCAFVSGTCVGCGGNNLACGSNTCTGSSHTVSHLTCHGDPGRTANLGEGHNNSRACRSLDNTDQATCENAFYHDDDGNSDFGEPVSCYWHSTNGSCVGCGGSGNICPFNECDVTRTPPDAVCAQDPSRTNLLGFGGSDERRCRVLDETDRATCENAYYEDASSGLAIACWWDGDDCRGSGFGGSQFHAGFNSCLSSIAPAAADATCPNDPDRTSLLGFGGNIDPCRGLDEAGQTACEDAYFEDLASGSGVACWWDGDDCRGADDEHRLLNACQLDVIPAAAVCADGRTSLLGFGGNDSAICRSLDNTDQATCESAYYEDARSGSPIGCAWDDGMCGGCAGRNSDCDANLCVDECPGDPTRSNYLGEGGDGGPDGNVCRQLDNTDEASCEDAFYFSLEHRRVVGCLWIGPVCEGASFDVANDACRVDAECNREPGRTRLGFGGNESQPCRQFDSTDQTMCEDAYYEDEDYGRPVACWWAPGDLCLGSRRRNELQNACLREPLAGSATCAADPSRTLLIGFGSTNSGEDGGACNSLTSAGEAICETAFYQSLGSQAPVACWWDSSASQCRGSSDAFAAQNTCDRRLKPCTFDPSRTNPLGVVRDGAHICRQFDSSEGGDQATCEDAYYTSLKAGAPMPVACWWNDDDCRGSLKHFDFNECFYDEPPRPPDVTCEGRTNLLGIGRNGSQPCASLDQTDEPMCENAFYQHADHGYAVACWWDPDAERCRGTSREFASNNDCPNDVICPLDPERSTRLGFGNTETGLGQSGGACRQLDGVGQAQCENAFYVDATDGTATACWWNGGECLGSSSNNSELNSCQRQLPPLTTCPGRTTNLGFGSIGIGVCRQLDSTSQADCEDAFYTGGSSDFGPVACTWIPVLDQCRGTARTDLLNTCIATGPPVCTGDPDRSTFIGKGGEDDISAGQNGGACRQFDGTSEETCEDAFYVNDDDHSIGCWWNGASCLGTARGERRIENACAPADVCGQRQTVVGFGQNNSQACRLLNNEEAACNDAYYLAGDDLLRPVACHYDVNDGSCDGCGRSAGRPSSNTSCEFNECIEVTCDGAPARTLVPSCNEAGSAVACEDAWHITGSTDFAPIAASCFWDAAVQRCLGCGPFSQARRECANVCETGCGNGVIDDGETCDDGNMFDGDCCDSSCQLEANGSACTDRLFCTVGSGTCQAGDCVGAPPRVCATCVGNDCIESENDCARGGEGAPLVVIAAQLSGMDPFPDMSFPLPEGSECDNGIADTAAACDGMGSCVGLLVTPTATATATATATETPLPSSPTPTRVPLGGSCTNTGECVSGAACVDGICEQVLSPAPAASGRALFLIVAALLGIAALRFGVTRPLRK